MAYTNKTTDEIYSLLITSFEEKFNTSVKLLPKSFIAILCKILAGVYITLFKLCGWFYLQLFPDTAAWEETTVQGEKIRPLVKLGNLFGVTEPESGKAWSGVVRVQVAAEGKTLAQGTQLKSDFSGLIYCLSDTVRTQGETMDLNAYCAKSGEAGNLTAGQILKFVNPLAAVKSDAEVVSVAQLGTDDETEEHYRARVVSRYSMSPQGGALSDYRLWAFDVSGVLQTYPYNNSEHPGAVLLYVAGVSDIYPDRIPDRDLCVQVGKACTYDPETGKATRKPLTAVLDPTKDETYQYVVPVGVKKIDVKVSGLKNVSAADFGSDFKKAVSEYFLSREPYIRGLSDDNNRVDAVLRNSVAAVANSIAVSYKADFGTVEMVVDGADVADYTLAAGELAALGDLYIEGEIFNDEKD